MLAGSERVATVGAAVGAVGFQHLTHSACHVTLAVCGTRMALKQAYNLTPGARSVRYNGATRLQRELNIMGGAACSDDNRTCTRCGHWVTSDRGRRSSTNNMTRSAGDGSPGTIYVAARVEQHSRSSSCLQNRDRMMLFDASHSTHSATQGHPQLRLVWHWTWSAWRCWCWHQHQLIFCAWGL